ncbi:SDR family NAD(P)-dependent oxidoreductase [Nonomuraea ferruginea]
MAKEVTDLGGEAVSDGGDIGDTATGRRLVEMAVESYGRLDVVVNVAGILRDKMIFNLPEEDWDEVIRVHLRGHFSTIKPAAAYWRQQRNPDGHYRIINFTSDSALQGSPGQPNYAAAKMGIIGLTASLANGLARYGVTANAIAPRRGHPPDRHRPRRQEARRGPRRGAAHVAGQHRADRHLPRRHRVRLAVGPHHRRG